MTRKDIIKEMEVRGYKAVEREIVKNGVVFEVICVQLDKQAGVLLYPQKQIECAEKTNQSIGEVVNELLKAVEAARNEKPSLSQVPDRAFMKSHDYRHTVATDLHDTGISIQALREYLGHRHVDMTKQYIDMLPKRVAKMSDEYFAKEENHLLSQEDRKHG